MKRLIYVFLFPVLLLANELWRFDINGALQFPIPVMDSKLGNDFTSIAGGAIDSHIWLNGVLGAGTAFSVDYISELGKKIDLVALTPVGMLSLRQQFGERGVVVADLLGGATFHQYRSRGQENMDNKKGFCWGGKLSLPISSVSGKMKVGPTASVVLAHTDIEKSAHSELFISLGIRAGFSFGEL